MAVVLVPIVSCTNTLAPTVTNLESMELQSLVDTACHENAAFFDTAERYGSNLKTALGLGWGETEMLTEKLLSQTKHTDAKPILASKFTPSPWPTTPDFILR